MIRLNQLTLLPAATKLSRLQLVAVRSAFFAEGLAQQHAQPRRA
jgi:hypothetical protein